MADRSNPRKLGSAFWGEHYLRRRAASIPGISLQEIHEVLPLYPMRINALLPGTHERKGGRHLRTRGAGRAGGSGSQGDVDPLREEDLSPVPGLTHKYPDRVLLLVSNQCAMYCRFCNRKRKVGRSSVVTGETIREGLSYIRKTRAVRDVLLSGGDPLLLSDRVLFRIPRNCARSIMWKSSA